MRSFIYIAALALVGCHGHDSAKPNAQAKAQAADPWAKHDDTAVDPKDPDLARMVALATGAPGTLEYPQADAVVALDRDDITLKPDGAVVHHHKSIVKILDAQRGKEKFADVHVPFDSKRQTLDIKIARTVNADGKPHAAAPEEIGDIVPPRLADATIYSDVRERVVSFPAVDKGSVIELEYTRTTNATPDAPMGGEELLGDWDPILERTVTITAPSGIEPRLAVAGVELKPTESDTAAGHMWTYTLAKQPDRHEEHSSPVDAAVLPRVVFGFQDSWSKVLDPIAARFVKAAVPSPIPDAVKQQADQLVAGAANEADKAQRLFAFVAHDIRSVDLPLGWAGYEPHAPDVVLANRYADERDKVGLLLALAAAEGIHGQPIAVRTGNVPVIASVPTIAQFDRLVAKLTIDGNDVWLAPSDEHAQYAVVTSGQDNLVLPLVPGGAEVGKRPLLDPSTSVASSTISYVLSPNGDVDAKMAVDMTGYYADVTTRELRPLKGEMLDQWFQEQAVSHYPAALDKHHEVGDTMSVSGLKLATDVAMPGYSATQGNVRVFELPEVGIGMEMPDASLSVRKYPLEVGTPRTEKGDVTVQVPAGWKIAYVPPKLEGGAEGVSYTHTCDAKGQTVTCHVEVKLDKLVIAPEQYAAYHDALAKLKAYERRVILLVKA
ncbi:MAG TPA: DUF3857 domain-containing protein [Kofleriaceae bacterium]|jgi:hypothetical protein